jgi:hypothetical protein
MSKTLREIVAILRVAEPRFRYDKLADYASEILTKTITVKEIKEALTNNENLVFYRSNPYEHLLACNDIGYLKLVNTAKRIRELENIVDMGTNGYNPEYNINGEVTELTKFDLPSSVNAIKAIREEITLLTSKTTDSIAEITLSIIEDNNNT